MNTLSTAITPNDHQNGRKYAGRLNGESTRRLRVGEERAARPDVRIPERGSGQPLAAVLEPGLELHGRVDQLVVRAERPHAGRAARPPRAPRSRGSPSADASGPAGARARTARPRAARTGAPPRRRGASTSCGARLPLGSPPQQRVDADRGEHHEHELRRVAEAQVRRTSSVVTVTTRRRVTRHSAARAATAQGTGPSAASGSSRKNTATPRA